MHIIPKSKDSRIIQSKYKNDTLTPIIFNSFQNLYVDEKHAKYMKHFKKNHIYWGLGIENELYLEFDKPIIISKSFFLNNHKRERYSVNYYDSYKQKNIKEMFEKILEYLEDQKNLKDQDTIELPLLINANSFIKTDRNNNSKTLYTKLCEPNPKFVGSTLFQDLIDREKHFLCTHNKEWLFDGDTIEFTTLNFYNNTLDNIISELDDFKNNFINKLQSYQEKYSLFTELGRIQFMSENHPFAVQMTNLNNVSIFNNGTLHYNITLPTLLDKSGQIKDFKEFYQLHKKAIKIIQWFEPLIISVYNAPDIFSELNKDGKIFYSKCSQRCALSRYIGIGTFDTDQMKTGKILTISAEEFDDCPNWWYRRFHQESGYNELTSIGLDINFNKYKNHGIELRLFDHINDQSLLRESFEFIIYLMDEVFRLNTDDIINPIKDRVWNNLTYNSMMYGQKYELTTEEREALEEILDIKIENNNNIYGTYYEIFDKLKKRHTNGKFSNLCLKKTNLSIDHKRNNCLCTIQ